MLIVPQDERFFGSTRGRIVALLRRDARTADELAQTLGLSDSAVRMHLAALERDGLAQRGGVRRGAGRPGPPGVTAGTGGRASKPAYTYVLTPKAERLFPKAYEPVLRDLLAVLAARLAPAARDDLLREVGRRLGAEPASRAALAAAPRARLEQAMAFFTELGGLPELEARNGAVGSDVDGQELVLRSHSCPLAAIVADHPEVCRVAEALLAEIIGAPVMEQCARGTRGVPLAPGEFPRCAFLVPAPAGEGTS
jgi:predicted ArsR family transcriptional regulator